MSLQKELFKNWNTYNFEASSKDTNSVINNTFKTIIFEVLRCSIGLESICTEFKTTYDKDFFDDLMKLK